jgi:outer membrane protein assembly factor BamB
MKTVITALALGLTVASNVAYATEPLSVIADGPGSRSESLRTLVIGFAPFSGGYPDSFATVLYSQISAAIGTEGDRKLDLLSDSDVQRAGDRLGRGFHDAAMQIALEHGANIGLWGSIASDNKELGITVQLTLVQTGALGSLKLVSSADAGGLDVAVPDNRISFVMSVVDRAAVVPRIAMARRESTMRSEPSGSSGTSVGATKAGGALYVLDVKAGWIKVRTETGREAYLPASDVDLAPRTIEITQGTGVARTDPAGPEPLAPLLIKPGTYSVEGMRRVPDGGLWYSVQAGDKIWLPATSVHARFSVPAVHFIAGLYSLHAHHFQDAVHSFEQFIEESAADETIVTLSIAQRLRGIAGLGSRPWGRGRNVPELLAPFEAAADLTPYDPAALTLLALARLATGGASDAAVGDISRAIKLDRQDAVANQLLSQLSAASSPGSRLAAALGLETVRERLAVLGGHKGPIIAQSGNAGTPGGGKILNYAEVTEARLENPDPGSWLLDRRTYDAHSYSPLDQINTSNVSRLIPVWSFDAGIIESRNAPPIVNNGVMFVTTSGNRVVALDAATGKLIWEHDAGFSKDLHQADNGVALWGNKVFVAQADGNLVALDAPTGEVAWTKAVGDYSNGNFVTMAPFTLNGKVLVGTSGGRAAEGILTAFNADAGGSLWSTYLSNAPRGASHEASKSDLWSAVGNNAWRTANYDPRTNTIFGGQVDLGVDPHSGKLKSSAIPSDPKYTHSGGELVQLDLNGTQVAIHPSQYGDVFVYDQSDGHIVNRWSITDSGCPATASNIGTNSGTYSSRTDLYYETSNKWCLAKTGSDFRIVPPSDGQIYGQLDARDPLTGKIRWKVRFSEPTLSGVLSTAGGLVFVGDAIGTAHAYDAKTGEELWKYDNGFGNAGGIISYEAKGKQFIVVDAGLPGPVADTYSNLFGKGFKIPPRGERRLIAYRLE